MTARARGSCEREPMSSFRYWDRPFHEWPRTPDGALALVNFPLDLEQLLSR